MNKMRVKTIVIATALLLLCNSILAQKMTEERYFDKTEMPNLLQTLPPHPAFGSAEFEADSIRYIWGKQQRNNPKRAAIAKSDAVYSLQTIQNIFSIPFGLQISETETPQIYKLLLDALPTCESICTLPKAHYMRKRPFMYFNEPTLTPDDERFLRVNGSYPSGHTVFGYSAALLLAEINPAAQDTILARGYMYGESRVIVGAHWQSDVNAGYMAASMSVAKLHTSKRFLEQMEKAKTEFADKTKKQKK